jgi:hypothetical protein
MTEEERAPNGPSEPYTVIDVRGGLPEAVLAELRDSRELYLIHRTETAGLVGYYLEEPDQPRRLTVLVVRSQNILTPTSDSPARATETDEGPLVVQLPEHPEGWRRALSVIQPGDVFDLVWTRNAVGLGVFGEGFNVWMRFARPQPRTTEPLAITIDVSVGPYPDFPKPSTEFEALKQELGPEPPSP